MRLPWSSKEKPAAVPTPGPDAGEPRRMTDDTPAAVAATAAHPDVRLFEAHRALLFSLAYRMLGSATEAEDVVQDAWLRYASAPPPVMLRSARAWLGTIVTRLCLDRLKAARTTREQYVGPWLPEPVLQGDREPSLARAVEQQESITLAFLVLLDSLTPQERAVFLLREVFDYEYRDIAEMLELSPVNCRQIFHRAKERIAEHRPRPALPRRMHEPLVRAFMKAVSGGNLDELKSLLTDDVVFQSDGGGRISAATRPVHGVDRVSRMLIGWQGKLDAMATAGTPETVSFMSIGVINGTPTALRWIGGQLDAVIDLGVDADGRIRTIDLVRNPDKLAFIKRELAALNAHLHDQRDDDPPSRTT